MNFEEWYNTKGAGSHAGHTLEKEWGGKEAWEACKKEVLKILNEHPNLDKKTSLDKAFELIKNL